MCTSDVLIVGAGPTGLSLAACLTRLGITIKIIEKKPGLSETSKATNLMQGTQEQLAIFDLINPMIEMSGKMSRMIMEGYGENLGARSMHLDESPYEDVLLLGQDNIERSLAKSLSTLGVSIDCNQELIDLKQDDTGVTVSILSETYTNVENFKYVVGVMVHGVSHAPSPHATLNL